MPVGQGAMRRVRGEIGPKPLHLRRRGGGRDQRRAAAVQHHDVPGTGVVAVVALLGVARSGAEIAEIAGRVGRLVLHVAGGWLRAPAMPSPRRAVAGGVLGGRAIVPGVVARREDGSGNRVEQVGREGGSDLAALRDVTGPDQRDRTGARSEVGGWRARYGRRDPKTLIV